MKNLINIHSERRLIYNSFLTRAFSASAAREPPAPITSPFLNLPAATWRATKRALNSA